MNRQILSVVFIFLIGCKYSTSESKQLSKNTDSTNNTNRNEAALKDTTGFFSNCQELISHATLGSLQGVQATTDSLTNLFFSACYECKRSYEIILVSKSDEKRKDKNYPELSKDFNNGCENYFINFDCFAFVCPMRDPDKQENVHAMNINFPVEVLVYERISNDDWRFIKKGKAGNFKEYARLQFNSIYHHGFD